MVELCLSQFPAWSYSRRFPELVLCLCIGHDFQADGGSSVEHVPTSDLAIPQLKLPPPHSVSQPGLQCIINQNLHLRKFCYWLMKRNVRGTWINLASTGRLFQQIIKPWGHFFYLWVIRSAWIPPPCMRLANSDGLAAVSTKIRQGAMHAKVLPAPVLLL